MDYEHELNRAMMAGDYSKAGVIIRQWAAKLRAERECERDRHISQAGEFPRSSTESAGAPAR